MAQVIGKIGALKMLKSELNKNGILKFNSIKELKHFKSNFHSIRQDLIQNTQSQIEHEIKETLQILETKIQEREEIINNLEVKLDEEILDLKNKIKKTDSIHFFEFFFFEVKKIFLNRKLAKLIESKPQKLQTYTRNTYKTIEEKQRIIDEYGTNPDSVIQRRLQPKIQDLDFTLKIINQNQNLISGAIGENLVVQEIKKLSDDFVLINDVNLKFYPPIYNKKNNDRIYSVQIDHVVVSTKGIFILETKNWSNSSLNSFNLRSPIEQIKRANFALYIFLSEQHLLNNHHWGEQHIPIRNVIVMINQKPNIQFKFVAVKLLSELNNYLNYFEPVISKNDVSKIVNRLKSV